MELGLVSIQLLKTILGIYSDKKRKEWAEEISEIEKELWRQKNMPHHKRDMARVDNLLERVRIHNIKVKAFLDEKMS